MNDDEDLIIEARVFYKVEDKQFVISSMVGPLDGEMGTLFRGVLQAKIMCTYREYWKLLRSKKVHLVRYDTIKYQYEPDDEDKFAEYCHCKGETS